VLYITTIAERLNMIDKDNQNLTAMSDEELIQQGYLHSQTNPLAAELAARLDEVLDRIEFKNPDFEPQGTRL
jgi:hypothetical protein